MVEELQSINFNTDNCYWLGISVGKHQTIEISNLFTFKFNKENFLIIADNSIDLLTLHTFLRSTRLDYYYYAVESINEAKDILHMNNSGMLVFSFIDNKRGTLLNFIKHMKKRPFIFIGGPKTKSVTIKAMKFGVFDYLIKDTYGGYVKHLSRTIGNLLSSQDTFFQESAFDLSPFMELVRSTKAIVYYLEPFGPNFLLKSPSLQLPDDEIQRIGLFYYLAVGQGLNYNVGLFQLPVPYNNNLSALIYSFKTYDAALLDTRLKKENYCLLALLFPSNNRFYLHHLTVIEQILTYQLKNCRQLSDFRNFSNIIPIIPQLYAMEKFIN